jgi:hypothetical protein
MSIYNGTEQLSSVIGSRLYEHVFQHEFAPLLWVAAGSLATCFLLVPFLHRQHKAHQSMMLQTAEDSISP